MSKKQIPPVSSQISHTFDVVYSEKVAQPTEKSRKESLTPDEKHLDNIRIIEEGVETLQSMLDEVQDRLDLVLPRQESHLIHLQESWLEPTPDPQRPAHAWITEIVSIDFSLADNKFKVGRRSLSTQPNKSSSDYQEARATITDKLASSIDDLLDPPKFFAGIIDLNPKHVSDAYQEGA